MKTIHLTEQEIDWLDRALQDLENESVYNDLAISDTLKLLAQKIRDKLYENE